MRLVNQQGADSVQHPEHGAAAVGDDGVFELPEPFGEALLKEAPAQWRTEAEHIAEAARRRLAELANPKRAAEVLDFVHGRVTALEARVAELECAAQAALEPPADPPADPKPGKSK